MSGILTRFRIERLHGTWTIDVNIKDNQLILVGENGSSKSTVANLIYFFLTGQWKRMLVYDFETILTEVNSQKIELTRQELFPKNKIMLNKMMSRYLQKLSPDVRDQLEDLVMSHIDETLLNDPIQLTKLAHRFDVSSAFLRDYFALVSGDLITASEKREQKLELLKSSFTEHVLYLPTYRRVEQDLTSIFPSLASSSRFKESMENWKISAQTAKHTELVQFGMQDVEDTIDLKMGEIKDNVRNDLSKLTGTYLRDIIRRQHLSVDLSIFKNLDDLTVTSIFKRMDESILPIEEQAKLRDMIKQIKTDYHIQDEERVIAHFLTRLVEMHNIQQENEKDVREFVKVCNKYLSGKKFIYNDLTFETYIVQEDVNTRSDRRDPNQENGEVPSKITLKMLSSGEKQIVSLFSQIYLTKRRNYFVIIDEPELSLSVPWQRQFLPDILSTDRCKGLIAVTHSPFIFENQLDDYVYGIDECREMLNGNIS